MNGKGETALERAKRTQMRVLAALVEAMLTAEAEGEEDGRETAVERLRLAEPGGPPMWRFRPDA